MELTSEQALRADIATLTSEIASLTTKRNVLTQALAVITGNTLSETGDTITVQAVHQPAYASNSLGVTVTKPPKREGKGPGGHFTAYSCEELRDVVVQQEGEFTYVGIAEIVGRDRQTIRKYMKQLIDRGIVTVVGGTGMRSSPVTLRYNRDIPAGPNTHPREPTPEKNAIGATIAGSTVESNGRIVVRNTMIQGLVNAAYNQGWDVSFKDGSHLKFTNPDGRTVGVSANPPNRKVGLVIKRDLKRSGLNVA